MNMEPIIAPVDRELIHAELNKERFLRHTKNGDNEIYIVNHHNAPNVMREIGRLREEAFRGGGGGTGMALDIDENDTMERCYQQLIVFDPECDKITGGYRFISGPDSYDPETDTFHLSTAHYFNFTDEFRKNYLPYAIELGRSWVNPEFQAGKNPKKGIFSLPNLWDGLGTLIMTYSKMRYFFGKVTMYQNFNQYARNQLYHFMHHFFPDKNRLAFPKQPVDFQVDEVEFNSKYQHLDYKKGVQILQKDLKALGENIPPLIGIYMNISPSMKTFGTAINPDFGGVLETGIMIAIDDIYPEVIERHS